MTDKIILKGHYPEEHIRFLTLWNPHQDGVWLIQGDQSIHIPLERVRETITAVRIAANDVPEPSDVA